MALRMPSALAVNSSVTCNTPDRSSKYVPQVPYRKQSVFVAPSGLNSIVSPPPPPPPLLSPQRTTSPPRKSTAVPNAQILEQHISKIISENQAIVETLDPLWSKRYNRDARNISTPSLLTVSHNGVPALMSGDRLAHETRRYSEANCNQPLSKLQSALLGKSSAPATLSTGRKLSEYSNESQSHASVIINAKDNNGERINSIVRNLLTARAPAIHVTPPENTIPVTSVGAHPQNPEGSIIKDLLLKSRDDDRRAKSRPDIQASSSGEQESSMLVYVCTVCNIAFRNKENLEVHQIHYCKGNNELVSADRLAKHKMDDLVQRKVSVMARPMAQKHYHHQGVSYPLHQQKQLQSQHHLSHQQLQHHHHHHQQQQQQQSHPITPVGNILKQQLLAPSQGPPMKKRKISEPVFQSNCGSADVQIIDETPIRRISVVQTISGSSLTTMPSLTSITSATTKSMPHSSPSSLSIPSSCSIYPFYGSYPYPSYPSYPPYSSSSHIQPVLHSGGTVIENLTASKPSTGIPVGIESPNMNRHPLTSSTTTTLTTKPHQPVSHTCGPNLVRGSIEMLPAYLPHLSRPQTKISFKGPIVFPVLKSLCANGTNVEFTVDDCGSFKLSETLERKASNTIKQVASVPQQCHDNHITNNNNNSTSNETNNEEHNDADDDEVQVVPHEESKELSPGLPSVRTTGAIRPRTLSLQTNASCLISSTLISPDTPRPKKSCVQLYLNGHAYTTIGLKVTTRPTYCCIYRAQPMFITQKENPGLSMYSNWKASPLPPDDILRLAPPPKILDLYDSRPRQRSDSMVIASSSKCDLNSTHSSYWQFRRSDDERDSLRDTITRLRHDIGELNGEQAFRKTSEESAFSGETDSDGGELGPPKRVRIFEGGFKSNEDYTYVRGRGRGKYVCEECGIRCKKPSMLKKHIRTHTDLRPYSCRHCAFAFKTKGNLTKHMKSKAHHKKCVEMGIIPVPITIDESQIDTDALAKQEMLEISCGGLPDEDDDDEDEGEYDEDDDEEDDDGVPIPLIELRRHSPSSNSAAIHVVPGQFEDADNSDDRNRNASESESVATESEEQEAARSLLILSGSGSESDLTAISTATRKSSTISNMDDIRSSPVEIVTRKVSVIDRRMADSEPMRRISQALDHNIVKATEMPERLITNLSPMHSPIESVTLAPPPPPLMPSPRKLSPIEHLQQQVQQQQQLMQTTWTPNCDSLSRPRSFSFNDVPLNSNVFASTSHQIPELPEPITDESSDDSIDSFAARRYSTSVIAERRWNSQPNAPLLSAISEREEPMDLSLNQKSGEMMDILPHLHRMKSIPLASGLRQGEFIPTAPQRVPNDSIDGKSICSICNKQFIKPSQLRLHINIHYFERPFRCDSCAVSFRTKGHLQKHKRSVSHFNKVNMNMTFGTPTTDNPRPFKCADCKIAFRIHGHLAKHLRSKMHIMKLECLGKLPFGMYAEMERSGVNLNEIDTTDCENSLQSLQMMAQRLYDPRQMRWASEPLIEPTIDANNDDSIVKIEPSESYYHIEDDDHSITIEPIEPSLRSSASQECVRLTTPSPVPAVEPSSPPEASQQSQSSESPPALCPARTVGQQSGFTSTRSNTCHLCGRLFKGAKFLQVHLYCDHQHQSPGSQADDRPEYECEICHKGFHEITLWQQHLLTHSAPRPYVCDVCDAGFTSSLLLAAHIPTHHPLSTQAIV